MQDYKGRLYGMKPRGTERKTRKTVHWSAVRLAVSGAVLFAALLVKLLLPEVSDTVSGAVLRAVNGSADYRAAFSALGEALGGRRAFGEAVQEAGRFIFSLPEAE